MKSKIDQLKLIKDDGIGLRNKGGIGSRNKDIVGCGFGTILIMSLSKQGHIASTNFHKSSTQFLTHVYDIIT